MKIWSLFSYRNRTTDNKILWKRGEIAGSNFSFFHNIFNISLTSGVKYIDVRISRSISDSPLDFEITRVDCSLSSLYFFLFLLVFPGGSSVAVYFVIARASLSHARYFLQANHSVVYWILVWRLVQRKSNKVTNLKYFVMFRHG